MALSKYFCGKVSKLKRVSPAVCLFVSVRIYFTNLRGKFKC